MQTELSSTLPGPESPASAGSSSVSRNSSGWLRPLLELIAVIGSLEILLFPLHDSALRILLPLPVALLLIVAVRSARRAGRTVRPGLVGITSVWHAWAVMLLATVAGALLFTALASWLELLPNADSKLASRGLSHWIVKKLPTVAVQQLGLQLFVVPACFEIFRRRWLAVAVAAAVFGLIHLPNLPLMALTFCGGLVWCSLYLRTGRIAPLVVSHLLLAVLAAELAGHSLYHMRVGAGCLELLPYQVRSEHGDSFTVVPDSLVGSVDVCQPTPAGFTCRGWVLDRRCTQSVNQIIVVVDARIYRFNLAGLRRRHTGAAEMYGTPEQEMCGFHLPLTGISLRGASSIEFYGSADDGAVSAMTRPRNMRATPGGYQFD